MTSYVVLKCVVESTQEVLRLRIAGPLQWEAVRFALANTFGPPAAAKYEDDEGDWCTLTENTFEDFLVVNNQNLNASQNPVVKLLVGPGIHADSAFGVRGLTSSLPIPDGVAPSPAEACGPKPLLAALQQLSHGSRGGWTASNVCTLVLAFMPTLEQRALRKVEKMNKKGSEILNSLRDVLAQLNVQASHMSGLEDVAQLLQDMREGKRVHEFGTFIINMIRSLRTLPFPKQKELLTPALSVLLQARPNFFTEVFSEQTSPLVPHPSSENDMLELPSGRRVAPASVVEPKEPIAQHKVHLACLGVKSVPQNAWANLRISDKGAVGVGGVGLFATFIMRGEGQSADGLQKVSLWSCGGGGFLCSMDGAGFQGVGTLCPNAIFLLKPLGCKGSGVKKAPGFALLPDTRKDHALRVGARGDISSIPIEQVHDADNCAAFFILDSQVAQKVVNQAANTMNASKAAQQAASPGAEPPKKKPEQANQPGKPSANQEKVAKQAAKLEDKAAKEAAKLEDKASKQAAKLSEKEMKSAKKAAEQAAKEAAKVAERKAKETAKAAERKAKEAAKAAKQESKSACATGLPIEGNGRIEPVAQLSSITNGAVLFIESTCAAGRLRINKDGSVDAKGGWGGWTMFVAHLQEKGAGVSDGVHVALQSRAMPQRYLRMPVGADFDLKNFAGDGQGPSQVDSVFEVASTGCPDDANDCKNTFKFRPAAPEMTEQDPKTSCHVKLYMMKNSSSSSPCDEGVRQQTALQQGVDSDSDWMLEGSAKQLSREAQALRMS